MIVSGLPATGAIVAAVVASVNCGSMRRLLALPLLTWTFLLLAPALALASDNGEGLAGETNDKVVTFFSLGVVVFLAAFVIVASILQHKLEKRRDEKNEARLHQRVGW